MKNVFAYIPPGRPWAFFTVFEALLAVRMIKRPFSISFEIRKLFELFLVNES